MALYAGWPYFSVVPIPPHAVRRHQGTSLAGLREALEKRGHCATRTTTSPRDTAFSEKTCAIKALKTFRPSLPLVPAIHSSIDVHKKKLSCLLRASSSNAFNAQ
jgi:hypothetical protein